MHRSANRRLTLASSRKDSSKLRAITGSITLSSKFPAAPPKATAASLPITWATTWETASGITGLTFPGIIELPGWRSGMRNSARPGTGPATHPPDIGGALVNDTAIVRAHPDASTRASREPWASKWSLASVSGSPSSAASLLMAPLAKPGGAFRPVPTAVPRAAARPPGGGRRRGARSRVRRRLHNRQTPGRG